MAGKKVQILRVTLKDLLNNNKSCGEIIPCLSPATVITPQRTQKSWSIEINYDPNAAVEDTIKHHGPNEFKPSKFDCISPLLCWLGDKNAVLNDEQEKESIIHVWMSQKILSFGIILQISRRPCDTNQWSSGWIFLSHPHIHDGFL